MAFHKKKTNVTSSILVEQSQPIDVSTKNINWFLCVWDQNLYLHLWKEESMHHILYQKQMIIWHFNFCLLITKLPLCLFTSRSQTQTRRSWRKNRERFDIFCKTNLKLRGIAPESVLIQWKNWRARLSYSKHLLSNISVYIISDSFLIHFWSLQFLMSSRHCRALTLSIPSMQSRCPSTWYLAASVVLREYSQISCYQSTVFQEYPRVSNCQCRVFPKYSYVSCCQCGVFPEYPQESCCQCAVFPENPLFQIDQDWVVSKNGCS